MMAWALAFAGLFLVYPLRSWRRALLGALLIVGGAAFKQPAAMLALVPPIVALIERRALPDLARSLAPLAGIGLFFLGLRLLAPTVWFYMVTVPRLYPISPAGWLRDLLQFLAGAAPLWVAVGAALGAGTQLKGSDRLTWMAVAGAVTAALASLAQAKAGGLENSMIPAWISVSALAFALLGRVVSSRPRSGLIFLTVSLALLLASVTPQRPSPATPAFRYRRAVAGAEAYRQVVRYAAALPGVVTSPEDPTISIAAKGQVSPSIFAEYDARAWPKATPPSLLATLARADYVVDNLNYWQDWLKPDTLSALGFTPQWTNGDYAVWRRRG